MARRSNKTSHVLSLLTDPKSAEPSTEYVNEAPAPTELADTNPNQSATPIDTVSDTEPNAMSYPEFEELPDTAPDPAPKPAPTRKSRRHSSPKSATASVSTPQPSVDLSQALEERISQQIHDSLSAQLAEDEEKEIQRAQAERKIADRIAAEMNRTTKPEPVTEPEETPMPEDVPVPTQQTSDSETPEYDFELVNIMDAILDQFQTEFMEKFGMCTCHRCWLDTRALTLSSLNGKYVVLTRDAIGPMLNFYDHRYRGTIMAQLTQACMTVMANPHH